MTYHYAYGRLLPKILLKIGIISVAAYFFCGVPGVSAQNPRDHDAGERVPRVPTDTTKTTRDTLSIDEVEINAGYYTVKDRERTGSIGRVDGATIARQPVSNPLASLHGQIPGVEVTQLSGVPGGNIILRIRGQNSLLNGSDPLYIIDGVPFMAGQQPLNRLTNASSNTTHSETPAGISPLSLLNPTDIESIEILKDADATAIYGSRGANGVVLITTKKATQRKLALNAQYRSGLGRPARLADMLSGPQYLAMRREAFANDGITPTAANAPDLVVWDTTQAIDFATLLLPGNARYNDAQLSVRGGHQTADFLLSGGYHDESTVYDSRTANRRFSLLATGSVRNAMGNLSLTATTSLSNSTSNLPVNDVSRYLNYFPYFRLYEDDGSLAWDINGTPYANLGFANGNPLAMSYSTYQASVVNLLTRASLTYDVLPGLRLKTDIGTSQQFNDEQRATPSTAIDRYASTLPSAGFSNARASGWTLEPQLSYQYRRKRADFSALVGATWQHQLNRGRTVTGNNYTSDILLGTVSAAGSTTNQDSEIQYRYQGAFLRLNGVFHERYIVNLTGRRDGSSRFSPENRYNGFAAIGAAWLLDAESFMQWATWLDRAKLRASYGITGNDQIGDYRYLDTWASGFYTYQGAPTIQPSSLYNPGFVWERNRKLEFGLETYLLESRLEVIAAYFRNVSDNQLVNYTLPIQTGFSSIVRNHAATILNAGWELQLGYRLGAASAWQWHTSLNVTLPRNELLDFPGLETSSYRTRFVLGEALSTRPGYAYHGVDPQTGLYDFTDVDGNGTINSVDAIFPVRKDLKLYGGWNNTLSRGNWSVSVTVDGKWQDGYNYLYSSVAPGFGYGNHPVYVLDRWRQEGDRASVQRFTASTGDARTRAIRLTSSNGVISDASYARLRNVSLSYALPERYIRSIGIDGCRLSCQGQNLFTLTHYQGNDPESQDFYVLPPLKTVVLAIELTL